MRHFQPRGAECSVGHPHKSLILQPKMAIRYGSRRHSQYRGLKQAYDGLLGSGAQPGQLSGGLKHSRTTPIQLLRIPRQGIFVVLSWIVQASRVLIFSPETSPPRGHAEARESSNVGRRTGQGGAEKYPGESSEKSADHLLQRILRKPSLGV